jgi:hypothetical protein
MAYKTPKSQLAASTAERTTHRKFKHISNLPSVRASESRKRFINLRELTDTNCNKCKQKIQLQTESSHKQVAIHELNQTLVGHFGYSNESHIFQTPEVSVIPSNS